MRILIMVHNLTGGGAERAAALWAKGFVDRGHTVGMVLNSRKDEPITYKVPNAVRLYNIYNVTGVEVFDWILDKFNKKLNFNFFYVRKLSTIFREYRPDVLIGVMHPWAEWARLACKNSGVPIINTEHSSFERPVEAPMPDKIRRMKYEWNKKYNHITVLTEADKRCVDKIIEHVSVLPNPLAYEPVVGLPDKQRIILAVGRLSSWNKGFDTLVNAWGKIAKKYPEWVLEIAGQDRNNAQAKLQAIADRYPIGKQIKFLGFQNDILPLYKRSSIFVLSSRNEGFGMVLIEAMSQGCACVACDFRGRQSEIISSPKEGILCPTDNVDALTKAIEKLIIDENYRHNIQINGIVRSRLYDLNNIMDKWEVILNKTIK